MMRKLHLWRLSLGRIIIHAGLATMPQGRARSELYQLMELWGTKVRRAIEEQGQ